jgi:circadian clock protein KaiC
MSDVLGAASVPHRVPTGIRGFDEVLGGGLFAGGVYIVMGMPGAGKTILGNQIAFDHTRAGGRAVYVTLLSESHGRLLAFLQTMSFFDEAAVGNSLRYLNGYKSVESEGLPGLLKLVHQVVRESKASLLVIDGMITAAAVASSDIEYKKFVQELQSWIELVNCTVILLTSARADELRPEYTMVDGIVELEYSAVGARRLRDLTVLKFRGSAYLEGKHAYEITSDGLTLFPRVEARFGRRARPDLAEGLAAFGVAGLDGMLEGGIPRGSAAAVIGPPGSGKTVLGLGFLAAGLEAGEPAICAGLCEDPAALLACGDALGLGLGEHARAGRLSFLWYPAAEPVLDRIGHDLLAAVERTGARRAFLDGLGQAFVGGGAGRERLAAFTAALCQELRARGVTLVASGEARTLEPLDLDPPVPGLPGIVDTVVWLGHVRRGAELIGVIAIPKARGRARDRKLFEYEVTHRGIRFGESFGEDGSARTRAGGAARKVRRARGGRRRKR